MIEVGQARLRLAEWTSNGNLLIRSNEQQGVKQAKGAAQVAPFDFVETTRVIPPAASGWLTADRSGRWRRSDRSSRSCPSLRPRSEEHTSELQSLRHLVC